MGETVTIVNQKGGVGKTTVALGLASAAMAKGHRVLVVDLDPQGASTWVLGVDADRVEKSVVDVLSTNRSGSAKAAIVPSEWSHLVDVLPSIPSLQSLEIIRGGLESALLGAKSETRLRKGLDGVTKGYGLVLIDCPPSLGALTTNALAAATKALLVVEPTALSLRGIDPVADLIEHTWEHHNQRLDLAGVVINRMPARGNDAGLHFEALRRTVGNSSLWRPAIPNRIVLAEAAAARRPIHAMGSRGADVAGTFDRIYAKLWKLIKPPRA